MPASDKWARITANVLPDVALLAKARAKRLHQSVAGYVTTLIERDLAAAEREQAPYGISALGTAELAKRAEVKKKPRKKRSGGSTRGSSAAPRKPSSGKEPDQGHSEDSQG